MFADTDGKYEWDLAWHYIKKNTSKALLLLEVRVFFFFKEILESSVIHYS